MNKNKSDSQKSASNSIDAKLGLNAYKLDKSSHLKVDQAKCKTCRQKYCLYICPARSYTLNEKGELQINFEGCLECGTCFIACKLKGLTWDTPRGGFGVQYRFG